MIRKYLYQAIPFYNQKVFKFITEITDQLMANGQTHEDYFKSYYLSHDNFDNPGEYEIMVTEKFCGDRINEDRTPFLAFPEVSEYGNLLEYYKRNTDPNVKKNIKFEIQYQKRRLYGDK